MLDLLTAIVALMGQVMLEAFTSPFFISIYVLLFTIVAWQYKRAESSSERMVEGGQRVFLRSALTSAATGLLGGLFGSLLLIIVGIDLGNIGLGYVWLLALLLMLINPRFLCFAYSAGILSLAAYFFAYPDISVSNLLGLVAVLHLIESLMIRIDGAVHPIPLYIKKGGVIRGGFNLQKFWPLPLVAIVGSSGIYPNQGLLMPEWWPLFTDSQGLAVSALSILPVIAVLGYGDITTTSTPAGRVKKSSLYLFIYSILLLVLAYLSGLDKTYGLIAAVFALLGHESVIWLGWREENNNRPLYLKPEHGVRILTVSPGSWARAAGVRAEDIILAVNGQEVDYYPAARELMSTVRQPALTILRGDQKIELVLYRHNARELGIIPVPEKFASEYLVLSNRKLFSFIPLISKKSINS